MKNNCHQQLDLDNISYLLILPYRLLIAVLSPSISPYSLCPWSNHYTMEIHCPHTQNCQHFQLLVHLKYYLLSFSPKIFVFALFTITCSSYLSLFAHSLLNVSECILQFSLLLWPKSISSANPSLLTHMTCTRDVTELIIIRIRRMRICSVDANPELVEI